VKAYRILSLDGGGIRGIVTVTLLQRLLREPGCEDLLDSVDLLAGTSTGGLIALALARGLPLERIRNVYVRRGHRIFDDSWLDDLVDLGKLRGADYGIANLRRELQRLLGRETTLGDLDKHVLITAFDLDNEDPDPGRRSWKPKLFHNLSGPGDDREALAWKVGLYTSAAPTYFPSVDGFIDGGVYAGNPAMCALAQVRDRRYRPTPDLGEVHLLSLGTGTTLHYIKGRIHDWGYGQWLKPLVQLILDGTAGIADYQCRRFLRGRYHRLAPVFPPGRKVALDDVRKIPFMIDFARRVPLAETAAWLRERWFAGG